MGRIMEPSKNQWCNRIITVLAWQSKLLSSYFFVRRSLVPLWKFEYLTLLQRLRVRWRDSELQAGEVLILELGEPAKRASSATFWDFRSGGRSLEVVFSLPWMKHSGSAKSFSTRSIKSGMPTASRATLTGAGRSFIACSGQSSRRRRSPCAAGCCWRERHGSCLARNSR